MNQSAADSHYEKEIQVSTVYFQAYEKAQPPHVLQTCDSMRDGKKKKVLCVSTVSKACFTLYCVAEML